MGRGRDRDLGGACRYSRRGLRLRHRGAYGIHRASGPRCQGLCSLRSGGKGRGGRLLIYRRRQYYKTIQPPCGRGKCIPPLVPYGTTFSPQFGGAAKGKRLNGQARRLTSPHLEVLCRTSTVGLWVLSHGVMSLQESVETYSAPCIGGSPAQPG